MPYTLQNAPGTVNKLPKHGQEIWIAAYNAAYKTKDEGTEEAERYAFAIAWADVKEKYEQDEEGKWSIKKMEDILIEREAAIQKVDEARQIVWGIVYEPDVVDTQGDFAKADEIEKACHQFLKDYNQIGKMHESVLSRQQAVTVESYIAPIDFVIGTSTVKKGSWVMAVHIPDEDIWAQIKSGEIAAFSMGGVGKRRDV